MRLPKDELEHDGLLEDGEPVNDDQQMVVVRDDAGEWRVRAVDLEEKSTN